MAAFNQSMAGNLCGVGIKYTKKLFETFYSESYNHNSL